MIERFFSESTIVLNQDSPGNVLFVIVIFVIALGVFIQFMRRIY